MIDKFKNSPFETIFVLSPCFISWALVFNFPDVKHILSKLVFFVCLYCVSFYGREVKDKINNLKVFAFLSFLLLLGMYFSFLHYYNDGHFDFPRAIFSCFFYFLLVPRRFFNLQNFGVLVSLASVFTVTKGIYDDFAFEGVRIGQVVNPGPSAYVFGLLLILQVGFLVVEFRNRNYPVSICYGLLSLLLLYAVYLTGTRTAWLGLSIVLLHIVICFFKHRGVVKGLVLCIFIGLVLIKFSSVNYTHERIDRTIHDIEMMMGGDYNSSSGTRVDLWANGVAFGKESFILGISRDEELKAVQKAYAQNEMQDFAYEILNHPRSSYHNVYIQSFVKGGLIALLLMLVWVFMPIIFNKRDALKVAIPITVMTVICSGFESQFTIYSACTYFYLLLMGYLILLGKNVNKIVA
jgi:O-antigen ligase